MQTQDDYLTLSEAAEYLGISRVTVWRRIREGQLATYQASTSRRQKLLRRADLDYLRRPRRVKRAGGPTGTHRTRTARQG